MADVNGKILVATDQHLGYQNCNVGEFEKFLDYVSGRDDVGTLAILGDLIDMWRRDVSGLFLETRDAMNKLIQLNSSRKVYLLVGNHDYHLRELEDHGYPLQFLESMTPIDAGSVTYKFMHGWEFDLAQQPPVMELLCHNLSDQAGQARSATYSLFQAMADEFKELFEFHGGPDGYLDHLQQTPEVRLTEFLPDVERRAYSGVGAEELLVFGHTHRPFISSDGKLVNAGSWVSDAAIHNTFVELDQGRARLFVFDSAGNTEITDRMPPP